MHGCYYQQSGSLHEHAILRVEVPRSDSQRLKQSPCGLPEVDVKRRSEGDIVGKSGLPLFHCKSLNPPKP